VSHRSAPIELRERLAYPDGRVGPAARELLRAPGIHEAAILSTCNRTELYAAAGSPSAADGLVAFLERDRGVAALDMAGHFYRLVDAEAATHLFRVACGLDSLVLGEPQILGQVRDCYQRAADVGAAGPLLHALFRAAIAAGKRARTETDIGRGGFSVGHVAVDLARSIFGSLRETTVLILGAGKMSELTARHLAQTGVRVVLVANRTHEKAVALASRLAGRAIRYEEFPEQLAQADIVISSTAAPTHVVDRAMLQPTLRRRRGRPLFFIDIAVPRDVAPDVADLENVFLYDLDDLQEVAEEMARDRAAEVGRVEAILHQEVERFTAWRRSLEAVPVLTSLKEKHEQIRRAELERLRRQLPDLPEAAWQRIELATRSMMNSVARDPIRRLKEAAAGGTFNGCDLLAAARALFALEDAQGPDPPDSAPNGSEPSGTQERAP